MSRSSRPVEAVVLGGGPAGAAAARLLAAWGHDVVLLPGRGCAGHSRAESLPPSCRAPFTHLGLLQEIEGAGFLPTHGNTTAWETTHLERSEFGGAAGYQVERGRLDALLRSAAVREGARVVADGIADRVDEGADGRWRVEWRSPTGRDTADTPWVLDCTGRAGLLAGRGWRIALDGPSTISIGAEWEAPGGWDVHDTGDTLVEAYASGWSWSVPTDPTRRHVAVMVDPALTSLAGRTLLDTYLAELARTRHTAALVSNGRRVGQPAACSATPYRATRYAGDGFLLVGDAASFIDPLSSFGVKKALASGWLAAVAVHTALIDPARQPAALELHEERETMVQLHYAAQARSHYARAAERYRTPFWGRRVQDQASAGPVPAIGTEHRSAIGKAASVAHAFEAIRTAPSLELRASARVSRVGKPTVRGREVVVLDHLYVPGMEAPLRYLGGIQLPRLVELAERHRDVPQLFADYRRDSPHATLPEILRALSTLVALGILEPVALAA